MFPDRYRGLAVKVAVSVILIVAITIALLYSGMISNVLPQEVLFGD